MKRSILFVFALAFIAAPVQANLIPPDSNLEAAHFAGDYSFDMTTGLTSAGDPGQGTRATVAYDSSTNPPSAGRFGLSSTDLGAIYGDAVGLITTGAMVENFRYSIFNGTTGGGATVNGITTSFAIYDLNDLSTPLGSFTVGPVNFTAPGLPAGSFGRVNVTGGITAANINLTGFANLLIIQQLVSTTTGTPTSFGVATTNAISPGTDPLDDANPATSSPFFLCDSADPCGYYTINSTSATGTDGALMYRVTVVPEPATLALLGFGALALIRRRR